MTDYRRAYVPGASWFFTVNLAERHNNPLLVEHIEQLRAAFRYVKQRHPYRMDAVVILPDHLHCIWTLPPDDTDFSTRWNLLKGHFSRAIAKGEPISPSRIQRRERGIYPQGTSGNVVFGSICCAIKTIGTGMSITSIGIRSSIVGWSVLPIGLTRVSINLLNRVFISRIGRLRISLILIPESDGLPIVSPSYGTSTRASLFAKKACNAIYNAFFRRNTAAGNNPPTSQATRAPELQ